MFRFPSARADLAGMAARCHQFVSVLLQAALAKLLLFGKLDPDVQRGIVNEMYERVVQAGEILINEGDTGLAASELYVVKSGKFEVGQKVLPS